MSKVDFYVINTTQAHDRLLFACRLLAKAYRLSQRVYVLSENQQQAHQLDELLWTYQEDSFVPHLLSGEANGALSTPIIIGHETNVQHKATILLNLSHHLPTNHQHYARIMEIVDNDPTVKQLARERYCHYQEQGYPINTHKIPS